MKAEVRLTVTKDSGAVVASGGAFNYGIAARTLCMRIPCFFRYIFAIIYLALL
ncbi:hypothetical protein BH18ACI3_BH18ACI3_01690 [soil metagenome]